MLKKSVEAALNTQANREFFSGYLYLSMAAYFESVMLKGFAHWLKVQSGEELGHGMKIYEYVIQAGGRALIAPIEGPKTEWKSPAEAFEHVYEHEKKVTGLISDLVNLSVREKDHATFDMLQWFVKEQVEEEEQSAEVLAKVRMAGKNEAALLFLDHELGKRE